MDTPTRQMITFQILETFLSLIRTSSSHLLDSWRGCWSGFRLFSVVGCFCCRWCYSEGTKSFPHWCKDDHLTNRTVFARYVYFIWHYLIWQKFILKSNTWRFKSLSIGMLRIPKLNYWLWNFKYLNRAFQFWRDCYNKNYFYSKWKCILTT